MTSHLWLPYTQMQTAPPPLVAACTEGCRIFLDDGRELIDGVASWWTACHGYNHPHIREAVQRQLEAMPHVMFAGLTHEPAATLARRLCAVAPQGLSRVFFSDSGSTSVEVALKMALQYWRNKGDVGRRNFIGFRNGYHGDTLGCMSVSDPEQNFHRMFKGALPMHHCLDIPSDEYAFAEFDELLGTVAKQIAAVIIEPLVQGAGGMRFHTPDILAELRRIAHKHNVLFIADEIFTGFGRTGAMFACQEAGISPDILCVGKALTGGTMTLAATLATESVFEAFLSDDPDKALMHGPTYMANPLACAAANASLDLFEREPRLKQVERIETQMEEELAACKSLPGVRDVRVKGAIGVVELDATYEETRRLRARFVEEGVWLRPFGNVVYLTPPFVIAPEELSTLTRAIHRIVDEWARR